MPVRPHRPARRAAALMAAASTLVVGALGGAQAATAQELGTGAGSSVVRPQATWPVDQPPPSDVTPAPPSTPTTTPTMPMDRVGCEADYQVQAEWPGGFVAVVRVVNVSTFSSLAGWEVRLDLPDGEVTSSWSSVIASDAGASPTALRPASWNAFIAYGATTELGFQGTGSPTLGTATCVAWPN